MGKIPKKVNVKMVRKRQNEDHFVVGKKQYISSLDFRGQSKKIKR